MTVELRRIPVWQMAKIGFIVFFFLSFALSLIYGSMISAIINLMGSFFSGMEMPFLPSGIPLIFLGIFISILLSILYTLILMFLALIYNSAVPYVGGIHFELHDLEGNIFQPHEPDWSRVDRIVSSPNEDEMSADKSKDESE